MALFGRKLNNNRLSAGAKIGIAVAALAVVAGIVLAIVFRPADAQTPGDGASGTGTDTVIHFVAGGDVNVTDKVVAAGGSNYDYADVFLDLMPVLSGGDLTTLNFEGNLYEEPYGSKHNSAPVELVQAMRNAGVDILQTANSKSITNGILGLSSTLEGIRSTGMQSVGTYATQEQFQRYQGFLIREVNGIRIAITAFTKGMDGRGLPSGSEHCVNLLYEDYNSSYQKVDEEGIQSVLTAIEKQKPDITIALLHWGSEFNDQISKTQEKIVKIMAEGGVDAIVGTHPHYVQKIGFDEETGIFVAYSLGDLLGDGDKAGTNYSVILDMEITRSGATGEVSVTGFDYVPVYHYENEAGQIRLLRIRESIEAYENYSIDTVTAEDYAAMKSALTKIENRVNG
ncbi:MAG: CapA family protein [Oscillospiraceae bacterium]|nr:CapA family protein [Oscillospiraceae bacterium]MBQ9930453.1 CapA family protein [Oscillospiraceae bacterium]